MRDPKKPLRLAEASGRSSRACFSDEKYRAVVIL